MLRRSATPCSVRRPRLVERVVDCSARTLFWAFCWALLTGSVASPAHAQQAAAAPPAVRGETPEARALGLGHAALLAFRQERYAQARSLFREAESLVHSPVFVLYLGRSAERLGLLLEAREALARCAGEALPEESPRAWWRAQAEAEAELLHLEARIPLMKVELRGALQAPLELQAQDTSGATLQIAQRDATTELWWAESPESVAANAPPREHASEQDRAPAWRLTDLSFLLHGPSTSAPVTFLLEANPGVYRLTLRDASGRSRSLLWRAVAGDRARRVSTFLEPFPPRESAAPAPPRPRLDPATREASSFRKGAWTALAAGGALVAAGLVAGGVAVERAATLRQRCEKNVCRPEDEALKNDALKAARLAAAGVGSGAVVLLTSGALFWWDAQEGPKGWSLGLKPSALELRYAF